MSATSAVGPASRSSAALVSVLVAVFVLVLLPSGCGETAGVGDGGAADATGDGSGDGGANPDGSWAPAAPAVPVLTPCPDGYRTVSDDGPVTYCDPWPASGHADDCPPAEAHFPGETGCAAVGTPCPADGFAAGLPTDGSVVFVAAGGRRGDGSRESPYPSLAAASIRSRPAGTVIALGVGAHLGEIYATQDLEVVGACASGTTLTGSGAGQDAILARGAAVSVRNLRVSGPGNLSGIDAIEGGSLDLEGVVIERTAISIYVDATSSLVARDLIVRDLVVEERWGMYINGTATLTHSVIEGAYNDGIQADGPGARVTLSRVAIRDTQMIGGIWGAAVTAVNGARIDATEVVFEGNHFNAVASDGAGSEVTLVDAVVRETQRTTNGFNGHGLTVAIGGALTASRTFIDRNAGNGVGSAMNGGRLTLADLYIRGGLGTGGPTLPPAEHGRHGRGMDINIGVTAEAERVAIEDSAEAGVVVAGAGALLVAQDLSIRATRPRANGTAGRGLNIQDGAQADLTRAVIEDSHQVGVFVSQAGSTLNLADVDVGHTRSLSPDAPARGVNVQLGAVLTLARVRVTDSGEVGIQAMIGSSIVGRDVAVSATRSLDCSGGSCGAGPGGTSLVSTLDSQVSLVGFTLDGGDLCGVQIAEGGDVSLRDGTVANHTIGACVQVEGFDIAAISEGVSYVDNGTNLDSTTLPVPAVIEP